jgi:hypothetical protein
MPARVSVRRGVAIRRIVATQSRAAGLARPQMDPLCSDFNALFALPPFCVFNGSDRSYVCAGFLGHYLVLLLIKHLMYEGDGNLTFTDSRAG